MFGKRKKLTVLSELPSCRSCLNASLNAELEYICKGKKVVASDHCCRKYELDITKAVSTRRHIAIEKEYDENDFKL